jgi:hypothetical protein
MYVDVDGSGSQFPGEGRPNEMLGVLLKTQKAGQRSCGAEK